MRETREAKHERLPRFVPGEREEEGSGLRVQAVVAAGGIHVLRAGGGGGEQGAQGGGEKGAEGGGDLLVDGLAGGGGAEEEGGEV